MADKPNPNRYLVLATDPDTVDWTILLQTSDADVALDYWQDNQDDPSLRIAINTGDFITFDPGKVETE